MGDNDTAAADPVADDYRDYPPPEDTSLATAFTSLANGFVALVQGDVYPIGIISAGLGGTFHFNKHLNDVLWYLLGYAVCVLLGLLFMLVTPIVGCCVCACRACGWRNAHAHWDQHTHKRCYAYSFALAACVLLIAVGVGVTYVANDRLTEAVPRLNDVINISLDNVAIFLGNVEQEIKYVTSVGFGIAVLQLTQTMEEMPSKVIKDVMQRLEENQANHVLERTLNLQEDLERVNTNVKALDSSIYKLQIRHEEIYQEVATMKNNLTFLKTLPGCADSCLAVNSTLLQVNTNLSVLLDISRAIARFHTLVRLNFTALSLEAKGALTRIPSVLNERMDDVNKKLDSEIETAKDFLKNYENDAENLVPMVNKWIVSFYESWKPIEATVIFYEHYRWLTGTLLVSAILLILLFHFIGNILGLGGLNIDIDPTSRVGLSACSVGMLMTASAFTFVIAPLLMLITSVFFLVGGNIQGLVCRPLTDPSLTVVTQIINTPYLVKVQQDLVEKHISVNITDLIKKNKDDHSATQTLFHIDPTVWLQQLDATMTSEVSKGLKQITKSLANFDFFTYDLQQQLLEFERLLNVNISDVTAMLRKDVTSFNFLELERALRRAGNDQSNDVTVQRLLLEVAEKIRTRYVYNHADVELLITDVYNHIKTFETNTKNLSTTLVNISSSLDETQYFIERELPNVVTELVIEEKEHIMTEVGQHLHNVTNGLHTSLRPVRDMWEQLVHKAFCGGLISNMNVFWLGCGWCIFFMMVAVIFNVKLAKYYRRDHKIVPMYSTGHIEIEKSTVVTPPTTPSVRSVDVAMQTGEDEASPAVEGMAADQQESPPPPYLPQTTPQE